MSLNVDFMAKISRCKPLLGTYVEVSLSSAEASDDQLLAASEAVYGQIQIVQNLMSFHNPLSELSQINNKAFEQKVEISPHVHTVLSTALKLSALSDGLYDISVAKSLVEANCLPHHNYLLGMGSWEDIQLGSDTVQFDKNIIIDLGGIAKGYAVDLAFDYLLKLPTKFSQIIINAGGDMRMLNWQEQHVGIKHPSKWNRTKIIRHKMQNTALATSVPGRGSQSSFVVDPRTQKRVRNNKSVSIFADKCLLADALTKLIYLAPERVDILKRFNAHGLSINTRGKITSMRAVKL